MLERSAEPVFRRNRRPALEAGVIFLGAMLCWICAFAGWSWAPSRGVDARVSTELTNFGRSLFFPEYDVPIYVFAGLAAVLTVALLTTRRNRRQSPLSESDSCSVPETTRHFSYLDIVAPFLLAALVLVVAPWQLTQVVYDKDGFHHVNFYLMGPLQAYRHGAALGTDAYTQYGSGWVLVYAFLEIFFRVDYTFVFATMPIFGALYFISSYYLLRWLVVDPYWAFTGSLTCVAFQLYCGTDLPLWCYPSSTVLRCPLDMTLAFVLLRLGRTSSILHSALAGALTGLSILFGTDTGIYVTAGVIAALLIFAIHNARSMSSPRTFIPVVVAGTAAVTLLLGFAIASRGTFMQLAFWRGYFESLQSYSSGFGALPLSGVIGNVFISALFMTVLLTYSITLGAAIAKAVAGRVEPPDLARAFLAVAGFGSMLIFVSRSHPYNIFHPICPACVIWTMAAEAVCSVSLRRYFKLHVADVRRSCALIASCLVVLVLLMNPNFWDSPSLLPTMLRSEPWVSAGEDRLSTYVEAIKMIGHDWPIRETHDSFSIVGEDPTLWLVTLKVAPTGRYCPAMPITQSQVENVRKSLQARVVVVVPPASSFPLDLFQEHYFSRLLLEKHYVLAGNTGDVLVYIRDKENELNAVPTILGG